MTEHPSAVHRTLSLERTYPAARRDVFAAWAVASTKARWFATPGAEHRLDFRVGGEEHVTARVGDVEMAFSSLYRDTVEGVRIVGASRSPVPARTARGRSRRRRRAAPGRRPCRCSAGW